MVDELAKQRRIREIAETIGFIDGQIGAAQIIMQQMIYTRMQQHMLYEALTTKTVPEQLELPFPEVKEVTKNNIIQLFGESDVVH